jgi:hypothetical protein
MAEKAQHGNKRDQYSFGKGTSEPSKGKAATVKDTAKTREAKRSKGGQRERQVKGGSS